MKIGIDIDGVLVNSEKEFRVAAEIYDATVLKRNSIVYNDEPMVQIKYNWTKEETEYFFKNYLYEAAVKASIMPGAVETIEFLKKLGYELVIITARGGFDERMIDEAYAKLKKSGMEFDKYFWRIDNKAEIAQKEQIDYMIDDYYKNCESMRDKGIKSFYLRDTGMKKIETSDDLIEVQSWGEIYRFFYNIENNK